MEDTLRERTGRIIRAEGSVLILVLMEDTLRGNLYSKNRES